MNIKVIVSAHKPYQMPADPLYLPLHVGKANHPEVSLGFAGDDTGDNISQLNARFNELTGIYWAWKNLDADCIGSAHYRRHFCLRRRHDKWESVLTLDQARALMAKHDVVVPRKRRYVIETMRSHYEHMPHTVNSDLDLIETIIAEKYPEYVSAHRKVMNRTSAHMCNMFLMKRELFDRYCTFLFDVMFEFDNRVDLTGRRPVQTRYFVSEFMLDTWLEANGIRCRELPLVYFESQYLPQRIKMLILRKLGWKRT